MKLNNIEKISNAVEDILRYHRDVIVSVREIHLSLKGEYSYNGLAESQLVEIILDDPRFEYIEMPDYFEKFKDTGKDLFEEQREFIEEMGFYSGPRVKLSGSDIEHDKIFEILERKVDTMMDILIALWDKRPDDDPNTEDKLLAILAKGQKMQREIKSFSKDNQALDIIQLIRKASDI